MLVVADSSPLNVLVRIGCVETLPRLFESVVIPPQVVAELTHPRTPQIVKDFVSKPPKWLIVRALRHIEPIATVDRGEEAAISLALELSALLLIDDLDDRRAALARSMQVIATLGVLQCAAAMRLVDLERTIQEIRRTDFRIADELLMRLRNEAE
jgi:predicted nucleic acid-binding protein